MQNYECYNFTMNFLAIMLTKKISNVLKWTPTHSTWHCSVYLLRTSFLHLRDMNFIPISIIGFLLNPVPVTASGGSKKSVFLRTGRLMSAVCNSSAMTNAPLGYLKHSEKVLPWSVFVPKLISEKATVPSKFAKVLTQNRMFFPSKPTSTSSRIKLVVLVPTNLFALKIILCILMSKFDLVYRIFILNVWSWMMLLAQSRWKFNLFFFVC